MKVGTILFLLCIVCVYFGCIALVNVWFYNVADWATSAAETALQQCRAILPSVAASTSIWNGSLSLGPTGRDAHMALNSTVTLCESSVHRLHFLSMERVVRSVTDRLNAAVSVVNDLVFAFDHGFLSTCNVDAAGGSLNETRKMIRFMLELQANYPDNFKYAYYDEWVTAPNGQAIWLDCGFDSDPDSPVYAMGYDQKYVYWRSDPTLSPDAFLWKDEDFTLIDVGSDVEWVRDLGGREWTNATAFIDTLNGVQLDPVLLSTYLLPVYRDSKLAGFFGVCLDMSFLGAELRKAMVTPDSVVFIVELWTWAVIAHTQASVPLFFVDSHLDKTDAVPFSITDIPSSIIRRAGQLLPSFLFEPSAFNGIFWNEGVEYVLTVQRVENGNLRWLVCGITERSFFREGLVSAIANVSTSSYVAHNTFVDTAREMAFIPETAVEVPKFISGVAAQLYEIARALHFTRWLTLGLAVIFALALPLFWAVVLRPVHRLSSEMNLVANLNMEHAPTRSSVVIEVDRMYASFETMVWHLTSYHRFLPQAIMSPRDCFPSPNHRLGEEITSNTVRTPNKIRTVADRYLLSLPSIPSILSLSDSRLGDLPSCSGDTQPLATVFATNCRYTHGLLRNGSLDTLVQKMDGYVQLIHQHCGNALTLCFFGDRVISVFTRASHPVAAVRAALALSTAALEMDIQMSVGLATGRVFMGHMGYTGLKSYNLVSPTLSMALNLMSFCRADFWLK